MSLVGHSHGGGDDHDENSDSSSSGLVIIRSLSIVILFAISSSVGLFVLRFGGKHRTTGSSKWYHVLLRYANPFTGGLFLALGLVHILPEANEGMVGVFGEEENDKYRYASMMAAMAFTLLLFLQRVVAGPPSPSGQEGDDSDDDDGTAAPVVASEEEALITARKEHEGGGEQGPNSGAKKQGEGDDALLAASGTDGSRNSAYGGTSDRNGGGGGGVTNASHASLRVSFAHSVATTRASAATANRSARGSLMEHHPHGGSFHDADRIRRSSRYEDALVRNAALMSADLQDEQRRKQSGGGSNNKRREDEPLTVEELEREEALATLVDGKSRLFTAFVLLLALSIHSIAAGLALGLADDVHGALIFAVALVIHKWAAALALGNSFALSPLPSAKCAAYIVFFSATTPLGVGLGWAASEFLPKSIDAFLTSFTAGTFLYLTGDVVAEEFTAGKRHAKKFGAFLLGLALVYAVTAASE